MTATIFNDIDSFVFKLRVIIVIILPILGPAMGGPAPPQGYVGGPPPVQPPPQQQPLLWKNVFWYQKIILIKMAQSHWGVCSVDLLLKEMLTLWVVITCMKNAP